MDGQANVLKCSPRQRIISDVVLYYYSVPCINCSALFSSVQLKGRGWKRGVLDVDDRVSELWGLARSTTASKVKWPSVSQRLS